MWLDSDSYSSTILHIAVFKIREECHQATELCLCQIYIVFLWHQTKNVPLELLLHPSPPCFYLPRRKSCTIWWKRNVSFMEREEEASPLQSQASQRVYSTWGKKMKQIYWKQMLTLCRLLKMERVHSTVVVTKGYWWQSGFPRRLTFPALGGQQKLRGTPNEVSLWF